MILITTRIRSRFKSLSRREKLLVAVASAFIFLITLIFLAEWVWREQARLGVRLPEARSALIRMQVEAAELANLQRLPVPLRHTTDTIAHTARAAAIAHNLKLEVTLVGNLLRAEGTGHMDGVIHWFAALQTEQGLRPQRVVIDLADASVRFEATFEP